MRSKYLLKTNQQSLQQDLPDLPIALKQDFEAICNTALTQDPYGCFGLPNHQLKGELAHCRAIEIDYNGISYRLVYRVYESPSPKRVQVISFAEHYLAYQRAKERK
ncbi:MAG: hypothetical protein LH649_09030 [Pseudanabaena sp. CAN_BIN31]|nr:hypothetical protein [Pseudanabaena sp. CAN_BIN31]